MRILAVTDCYAPRAGGVERVVMETARCLRAAGHEIEVLTRRLEPPAHDFEEVDGVPVWRIGPGRGSLPIEFGQLWRDARSWARQHLGRFELVHAHLSFVARPLLGAVGKAGVPLVVSYYGPWHREYRVELADMQVPSRWPTPLRRLAAGPVAAVFKRMQGTVLRAADRVVVLSEHSRGELSEFAGVDPAAATLVPGGVDLDRFLPSDRNAARAALGMHGIGHPLVVAVRRLVPRMGLDRLLEAIAQLRARFPRIVLAVAGVGPLAQSLEARGIELGIADRVHWLGRVADDALPRLYAAADLAVLPSAALEGFGLPVLEALACGTPVVSTPVGALPETVSLLDPSLVAADGTTAALTATLARALTSPPGRERARQVARSYGWPVVTDRLLRVYRMEPPESSTSDGVRT